MLVIIVTWWNAEIRGRGNDEAIISATEMESKLTTHKQREESKEQMTREMVWMRRYGPKKKEGD
jgi:hypothetical protein